VGTCRFLSPELVEASQEVVDRLTYSFACHVGGRGFESRPPANFRDKHFRPLDSFVVLLGSRCVTTCVTEVDTGPPAFCSRGWPARAPRTAPQSGLSGSTNSL
jgi:hypothetical protein